MDGEPKAQGYQYKTAICGSDGRDGCGKPIVWAKLEGGGAVPLDPRAPVYDVTEAGAHVYAARNRGAMVSHFTTCPKASNFTRPKTGGA